MTRTSVFRDALKLKRANIFDSAAYVAANPDLEDLRYAPVLHALRHARVDQRNLNQSAFTNWIMPYLLHGKVSARSVRKLVRSFGARPPVACGEEISQFCRDHLLTFAEYEVHRLYHEQNYDAAYAELAKVPIDQAFFWHELFERQHFVSTHLTTAFEWALKQLNSDLLLSDDFLLAARNIGDTLGFPSIGRSAFYMLLSQAALKTPQDRNQPDWQRLWMLGLPLLTDGSDLAQRVIAMTGLSKTRKVLPVSPPYPLAEPFATLLTVSAFNALSDTECALKWNGYIFEVVPVDPSCEKHLVVRLPAHGHWQQSVGSEIQAEILNAFLFAVSEAVECGATLIPYSATRMYNRRNTQDGRVALSYHTISLAQQNTINIKEAALPGYFTISRTGYSGWMNYQPSQENLSTADVEYFFEDLETKYIEAQVSKYKQKGSWEDLPDKYVFIALQMPMDTVAQLSRFDIREGIEALAQSLNGTDTKIAIKRHPHDNTATTRKWLKSLASTHSHVVETTAPIHKAIEKAESVIVVNSGVGFEALLHLKPVITIGDSEYSSVCLNARDVEELVHLVQQVSLGEIDSSADSTKRFLYDFLRHHCFEKDRMPTLFRDLLEEGWKTRSVSHTANI